MWRDYFNQSILENLGIRGPQTQADLINNRVYFVTQVSGRGRAHEQMLATVEFRNPFPFDLEGVYVRMEGPGIMAPKFKYYR